MTDRNEPLVSERGFKHYPDIRTTYGHVLKVYESSAAMEPCLWLAVTADGTANQEDGELHVHLTLAQAGALRNRLDEAMEGHYQLEPRGWQHRLVAVCDAIRTGGLSLWRPKSSR